MTTKKNKEYNKDSSHDIEMSTASRKNRKNKKHKKNKKSEGTAAAAAKNKKSKGIKNWSLKKKILMSILGLFLAFVIIAGVYVAAIIISAPDINPSNIYSRISQQSTLYDADGEVIENVFVSDGNRTNVDYKDMPEDLINAVVAIEDKTFWDHHGFNFVRMLGAVKDSISGGGQISGTSTITQQLARNVYLADSKSDRTLNRKLTEAYYTVLIERKLTKEQIIEAYLNTIYLGYGAYGVDTAAQAYFSKDLKDLDLIESAALAALPQLPDSYALIKTVDVGSVDKDDEDLLYSDDTTAYMYNGDASKERRDATLKAMKEQGYISQAELDEALAEDLRDHMKISAETISTISSYFTDYVIDQVAEDIMEEKNYSKEDARDMIYKGGLKIYTTMDSNAQKIVEQEFENNSNFPSVTNLNLDSEGNVLDKYGTVILYDYNDFFDDKDNFLLSEDEFVKNSDGSLTLLTEKHLNFYDVEANGQKDISVEFKPMWLYVDGVFHTIESGALSIPQKYKSKDDDGNVIISAEFFDDYPKFFTKSGSDLTVSKKNYTIKQTVRQPQAAMVIINNETGGIAAMVGGRSTEGKMLFNRSTSPRQPGSSIKPLAVYSSALQLGADAAASGSPMSYSGSDTQYYGNYLTAASVINDAPIGNSTWPKNWYEGYRGYQTLRYSVEQSINVNAVRIFNEVGADYATSQLEKFGITSVVKSGSVNDQNSAALALGGMTNGISPLEMASAYTTFPNGGVHKDSICYTKVCNSNDEVLLQSEQKETEVLDAGVAFIMTDILRTTVTNGIGSNAAISNAPVAGKTGTTSDNYDMWFAGCTPQYSAALWFGNDVNIELTGTSDIAAGLWSRIMGQVTSGMSWENFPSAPENVVQRTISGIKEYYVTGTEPSSIHNPDSEKEKEEKEKEKKEEEEASPDDDVIRDDEEEETPVDPEDPGTDPDDEEETQSPVSP